MNLLARLKLHALRSLARMDGQPMPDAALRDSLRLGFRHDHVTETHIEMAIRALDAEGYLVGVNEALITETYWSLSTKGQSAAARLA